MKVQKCIDKARIFRVTVYWKKVHAVWMGFVPSTEWAKDSGASSGAGAAPSSSSSCRVPICIPEYWLSLPSNTYTHTHTASKTTNTTPFKDNHGHIHKHRQNNTNWYTCMFIYIIRIFQLANFYRDKCTNRFNENIQLKIVHFVQKINVYPVFL